MLKEEEYQFSTGNLRDATKNEETKREIIIPFSNGTRPKGVFDWDSTPKPSFFM